MPDRHYTNLMQVRNSVRYHEGDEFDNFHDVWSAIRKLFLEGPKHTTRVENQLKREEVTYYGDKKNYIVTKFTTIDYQWYTCEPYLKQTCPIQ